MEDQPIEQRQHVRARTQQRGVIVSYGLLGGLLGALAVAGVAILILWQTGVIFKKSATQPIPGIHLTYPKKLWVQVAPATVNGAPPNTAAAIARKRGPAVILVERNAPAAISLAAGRTLEAQLKAKYSDFKPLQLRLIPLTNGTALLLAYERTTQGKGGELHTLTIVPAGPIDYTLESASPFGNKQIAGELQAIIASARLTPAKK